MCKIKEEGKCFVFSEKILYNNKMRLVLLTILAFNFEAGKLTLEKKDSIYITRLLDSVRIYNDTMEINGGKGTYNEVENVLFLEGRVRLKTPKRRVRSDSLVIRSDGNIILFMGGVVIVQDSDTLKAGKVYIEGDSLVASYRVYGYFPSKNIRFTSDTLYTIDSVYVLKGTKVRVVSLDTDSIVLEGSPIYVTNDTVYSPSSCHVITGKYESTGDTLYYFSKDSFGIFLGDVKIEWDSGYVTGDTAYFYIGDKGIDSIVVMGESFLKRTGEKNTVTLKGKRFKVTVMNNKVESLEAFEASGVLLERKDE